MASSHAMRTPLLTLLALLATAPSPLGQQAPPADAPRAPAAARAAELLQEAEQTLASGGPELAAAALVTFEQAAAWASQGRSSEAFARARAGKARCLRALGQPGDALDALDQAVATARSERLRELLAELLDEQSELAMELGRHDVALKATREAALVRDELGLTEEAVASLLRLAELELARGGPRAAGPALDAALQRAREAGLPGAVEAALEAKAELALASGDSVAARSAVEELLAVRGEGPEGASSAEPLVLLARALIEGGEREEAVPMLRDAATACEEAGRPACAADAREVLVANWLALDRPREAIQEVLSLVGLRRSAGDAAGELRAHAALARAFRMTGRLEPAAAALAEAEELAASSAPPRVRAALRVEAARILLGQRRTLDAAAAWDEAMELAAEPDDEALWPEAPTQLVAPPSVERLEREQLDFLIEAGLWGRALEACASCTAGAGGELVSLDELRDALRGQDAPLLTWRALDDDLVSWVLAPDGRLQGARLEGLGSRRLAELAETARELAPRFAVPDPNWEAEGEPERLRRALRRLHDALIGPLEERIGESVPRLVVRPSPELEGLPWNLLLAPDGRPLGERTAVAVLPAGVQPARRRGDAPLRIVADLRDPEDPGPEVRRLIARLDSDAARLAEERGEAAPRAERLPGERRYEDNSLVVLAGDFSVPTRLGLMAQDASLLLLHADCEDAQPPPGLNGALVALASCHGEGSEAAAERFLRAGARSVFVLAWDPGDAAREALTAGLLATLRGDAPAAAACTAAPLSGLPTTDWGALRLYGAVD